MIDTPPGTSDEHMSVVRYLGGCTVNGAIVVTTPQARICVDYGRAFCCIQATRYVGRIEGRVTQLVGDGVGVVAILSEKLVTASGADAVC